MPSTTLSKLLTVSSHSFRPTASAATSSSRLLLLPSRAVGPGLDRPSPTPSTDERRVPLARTSRALATMAS